MFLWGLLHASVSFFQRISYSTINIHLFGDQITALKPQLSSPPHSIITKIMPNATVLSSSPENAIL